MIGRVMETLTLKDQCDTLPGSIVITDTTSKVLYTNAATTKRTGFDVAEIIGKKPGQLWGGRMERAFYGEMWCTLAREKKSYSGVVENQKKNKQGFRERLFIVPIENSAKEIAYYAHISPDLDEREKEQRFRAEFFSHTRTQKKEDIFPWIFDTLRTKRDGTKVTFEAPAFSWQEDMARVLYEHLIQPIETLFVRREEDATLIARAQADPREFGQLYKKYSHTIKQYFLCRLSQGGECAEDLTQEVFARAYQHLPEFRIINASYQTYLLRIAHNLLVNFYRRQAQSPQFLSLQEFQGTETCPRPFTGESLQRMLQTLSQIEQEVILMKYRDEMKIAEIASRVGKTENAVKLLLSRARKKLKNVA